MKRTVRFGSATITYNLRYERRQRLAIRVHPNLTVTAVSPQGHSVEAVDARVKRRAPWILRQLRSLSAMHPLPARKRYVSGASHRLYGRELRLKVRRGDAMVKLDRPYLRVSVPRPESERAVCREVERWYHAEAKSTLAPRLAELGRKVLGTHIGPPALRVRSTSRRWGSCSAAGTITLNPRLIEHPRGCIDYVLVHELCHLHHLDHGQRFEALLTRSVPDWRRWRARLNNEAQLPLQI